MLWGVPRGQRDTGGVAAQRAAVLACRAKRRGLRYSGTRGDGTGELDGQLHCTAREDRNWSARNTRDVRGENEKGLCSILFPITLCVRARVARAATVTVTVTAAAATVRAAAVRAVTVRAVGVL